MSPYKSGVFAGLVGEGVVRGHSGIGTLECTNFVGQVADDDPIFLLFLDYFYIGVFLC